MAVRLLHTLKKLNPDAAKGTRSLAHALYDICENKRQDAAAAMPYNDMVSVWPEITWVAATSWFDQKEGQTEMQV